MRGCLSDVVDQSVMSSMYCCMH